MFRLDGRSMFGMCCLELCFVVVVTRLCLPLVFTMLAFCYTIRPYCCVTLIWRCSVVAILSYSMFLYVLSFCYIFIICFLDFSRKFPGNFWYTSFVVPSVRGRSRLTKEPASFKKTIRMSLKNPFESILHVCSDSYWMSIDIPLGKL